MLTVLLLAGLGTFAIGAIVGLFVGAACSPWHDADDPSNRSARTASAGVERFDGAFSYKTITETRGVDGDALYRSRCRR